MSSLRRIQMSQKSNSSLYSDAVIFGNMMVISGMLPTDDSGRVVGLGDAKAQAEQVFQNIKAVLDAAGAHFSDVVKLSIFLTDIQLRSEIASVRARYFGEAKPASTLLEISRLAHPDALMEIEAIIYLGD
ncbi:MULTISPECIES: RidA family protein [unclassified Paenibacillus]|uniref:RidA family protein n=1 Tax=unclassified Paenibacillus TaxID=185978 RepID=UPI001AE9580F|nr:MULTISPECIES: RidA family protein [unclassified Paenibacillus]MBP1154105.1 reactive intermediate/imine deaminase [Paenibacillus sp. PvP091]MBP1170510.1 reactive intermediate/imine deaminase [Paenibacillus sp. PvR098]MBP2441538.1 reactive intermediate/imine deaminase [Paenibacillus sp. PvP052]